MHDDGLCSGKRSLVHVARGMFIFRWTTLYCIYSMLLQVWVALGQYAAKHNDQVRAEKCPKISINAHARATCVSTKYVRDAFLFFELTLLAFSFRSFSLNFHTPQHNSPMCPAPSQLDYLNLFDYPHVLELELPQEEATLASNLWNTTVCDNEQCCSTRA